MIVHSSDPITLLGGASLDRTDLNKSLTIAPTIVAADGGARHLNPDDPEPRAIIGDFDSLPDSARVRFRHRLHHVAEQDSTDFEKVLQRSTAPLFLALGFLGGRIDHSFAALNVLVRYPGHQVILFGAEDIVTRVPGTLRLTLPVGTPLALLPMGSSKVRTKGLQWDMEDLALAPEGRVSSSNRVAAPQVQIDCQGPVLITLPKSMVDALTAAVRAQ